MFQLKDNKTANLILIFSAILLLSGCAGQTVTNEQDQAVNLEVEVDPYEEFNRSVYGFNESLDTYVAKPVSDAYLWVTPQFVQTGIANFFNNLDDINVVLNDVMQGKLQQGLEDTGRFAVNSTVGLLGLFDVASELGLKKNDEDFAQTLAVWGVPQGPYLVLPIVGPATGRGIPGGIFDAAANPASYIGAPIQMIQVLNARANAEGALNFIDESALDPYVFTRESYLQNRKYLITDGESEISDDILLDFESEFDEFDEEEFESKTVSSAPSIVEQQSQQLVLENTVQTNENMRGAFKGTVESLEAASRSFEEALEKLDRLEQESFQ